VKRLLNTALTESINSKVVFFATIAKDEPQQCQVSDMCE